MVANLNFGLLQPVDLSQAVNAFDRGRQMRMRRDAMAQEQQMMQQRLAMDQREFDRAEQGDSAVAGFFEAMAGGRPSRQPMPMSSAPVAQSNQGGAMLTAPDQAAPPMQGQPMSAPVAGDEPEMVVTAQQDEAPNPMRFLADLARSGQGQLAMQLWDRSRSMADDERKQAIQSYEAIVAATLSLAELPYEARRAKLINMAPALIQGGVPREMIEGFDPTDEALQAARGQALGVKGVLDADRADAQFAETRRANATREALTVRGQNMTDARAAQSQQMQAASLGMKMDERQQKAAELAEKAALSKDSAIAKSQAVLGAVSESLPLVGAGSAGLGSNVMRAIGGSDAANLQASINTIQANLAFGELQAMRAASPTGGALGAVSERELVLLGSTVASLDPNQSPERLRNQLRKVAQQYARWQVTTEGLNPNSREGQQRVGAILEQSGVQPRPQQQQKPPRTVAGGTLTPARDGVREWRPGGTR
jgi:hypothetical protein